MKRGLILIVLTLTGCGSDPDAILETDPFITAEIPNPPGNEVGILERSEAFAHSNELKMDQSTSHFEPGEYSAFLKRADLNIFVANVGRGRTTLLTAYARSKPTDAHRRMVEAYKCAVFYACETEQPSIG